MSASAEKRARRADLTETVQALRRDGLLYREIADRLDISVTYAHELVTDPGRDGIRARRARYRRPCAGGCGTLLSGGDGLLGRPGNTGLCRRCIERAQVAKTEKRLRAALRDWADLFGEPPYVADWDPSNARRAHQEWRTARAAETGRDWPSPVTAGRVFGSWNAFLQSEGYEPRRVGYYGRPGEDPAVVAETVRLYVEERLSAYEIARRLGMSDSGVTHRLRRAGIRLRTPAEAQAIRRQRRRDAA